MRPFGTSKPGPNVPSSGWAEKPDGGASGNVSQGVGMTWLNAARFEEWDAFVEGQGGTFFQTTRWVSTVSRHPVRVLLVTDHEVPVAGFCLPEIRHGPICRILAPPLTPRFFPVFAGGLPAAKRAEYFRQILEALGGYDVVQLVERADTCAGFPEAGFSSIRKHQTFVIERGKSMDAVRERYTSNLRNEIRRAAKSGLRVRDDVPLDEVLRLSAASLARAGRAFPADRDRFLALGEELAGSGQLKVFGASGDGRWIAANLLVTDGDACYNLISGIDRHYSNLNAGALLMDRCIEWSLSNNLTFDFEGSSVPGVRSFYRKFGPGPVEMATVTAVRSRRIAWLQRGASLFGKRLY